jgi:hypothetical protein
MPPDTSEYLSDLSVVALLLQAWTIQRFTSGIRLSKLELRRDP